MLQKLQQIIKSEMFTIIAAILLLTGLGFSGCWRPQCNSLITPGKKISRTELIGEAQLLQSRIDSELEGLEAQEQLISLLGSLADSYTATGQISLLSIITGGLAVFGAGTLTDNLRKRSQLSRLNGTTNAD